MLKYFIVAVAFVAVVAFGWYWNRTHTTPQAQVVPVISLTAASEKRKLIPPEIAVAQGSHVDLKITSDEPGVIHVEDIEVFDGVNVQKPAELVFTAATSGSYAIHIHPDSNPNDEIELGKLIVR